MNNNSFHATALEDILFSTLTTLRIGGPIRYLLPFTKQEEFVKAVVNLQREEIPFLVIGGGSNLLVADRGFDGLVVQNLVHSIERVNGIVKVAAGTDLQSLVWWANTNGYQGFEKLVGIPGSVGGAIYGNAGAYRQTISDHVVWVDCVDSQTDEVKRLSKEDCGFVYRGSCFKKTKDVIVTVAFALSPGDAHQLHTTSWETVRARMKKYPPGIACPGSFFKNVEVSKLDPHLAAKIPQEKIMYGKIPAGWLLEQVGARGSRMDGVEIASWHANLFVNTGEGTAKDFLFLARMYKQKVFEGFGIQLEPEVQLIGFPDEL